MKLSTAATRTAEDAAYAVLARHWDATVVRWPGDFAALDATIFVKHSPRAVTEIKVRHHRHGTYPDVWFERRKFDALLLTPAPLIPLFIAAWEDRIGWVRVRSIPYRFVWRERMDRGLPEDRDEVALVPLGCFTCVAR